MSREGYSDPTAELAVGRVMRKERIRKQLFKKAVEMLAEVAGFHITVKFVKKEGKS